MYDTGDIKNSDCLLWNLFRNNRFSYHIDQVIVKDQGEKKKWDRFIDSSFLLGSHLLKDQ